MGGFFGQWNLFFVSIASQIIFLTMNYTIVNYAETLDSNDRSTYTKNLYLVMFLASIVGLVGFIRGVAIKGINVRASRTIHAEMVYQLLHCKVTEFLDRVQIGQIVNRFSEDIEEGDNTIGMNLSGMYLFFSLNLGNLLVVVWGGGSPLLIFPCSLFILSGFYYR